MTASADCASVPDESVYGVRLSVPDTKTSRAPLVAKPGTRIKCSVGKAAAENVIVAVCVPDAPT